MQLQGIEEETFPPRYNKYHCIECDKMYLTLELAAGIVPDMMRCLRTEGCGGVAMSMGHQGGIGFGIPLLLEFVKPDEAALEKARKHVPQLYAYFLRGGLLRKVVDTAPDWIKKFE